VVKVEPPEETSAVRAEVVTADEELLPVAVALRQLSADVPHCIAGSQVWQTNLPGSRSTCTRRSRTRRGRGEHRDGT
jgi:hypothetical protein